MHPIRLPAVLVLAAIAVVWLSPAATAGNGPRDAADGEALGKIVAVQLASGEAHEGRFERAGDEPDGGAAHRVTFNGHRHQRVRVALSSEEFVPELVLVDPEGEEHAAALLDTERPTDAVLELQLPRRGKYTLVISRAGGEGSGSYFVSYEVDPRTPLIPGNRRYYGVFVGISLYPNGRLAYCSTDAYDVAYALRNQIPEENRWLLQDDRATRENILSALDEAASRLTRHDVFIFFYSGHGNQGLYNASLIDEPDRCDEFIVPFGPGAISDGELSAALNKIDAGLILVALDSCFSGGFAELVDRPGRMGMFSSDEDILSSVAAECEAGGYLSLCLREACAPPGSKPANGDGADGSEPDGRLTAGELEEALRIGFARHVDRYESNPRVPGSGAAGDQHLVVYRGSLGRNTVILEW